MERIASFSIDHLRLEPGVYVSRVDTDPETGSVVTTFDLRMTAPNREPVMDTAPMHAIEHIGATYLRNHEQWASRVLYFGPMGCRTGFYLLMFGRLASSDIADLMRLTTMSNIILTSGITLSVSDAGSRRQIGRASCRERV